MAKAAVPSGPVKVAIHLIETSQTIEHEALNTYTKGPLYCVLDKEKRLVYKYPISSIFRVVEDYD